MKSKRPPRNPPLHLHRLHRGQQDRRQRLTGSQLPRLGQFRHKPSRRQQNLSPLEFAPLPRWCLPTKPLPRYRLESLPRQPSRSQHHLRPKPKRPKPKRPKPKRPKR